MSGNLKKIVLSNIFLTKLAIKLNKFRLKKKHKISYSKNVFIGFSTICEGNNFFDSNSTIVQSKIGYGSYIGSETSILKMKIGKYTSIGPNISCIFGKHPTSTFVSTHPAFYAKNRPCFTYVNVQKFKEYEDPIDKEGKYSIVIGNDVWLGANVSILDGVKIGDGAIVASNSLVNKDIPAYSIFGGVPAKEIKKRFTNDEIEFLQKLKWWDKGEEWIKKHSDYFSDINTLKNVLKNE